jgi:quercetin dioxygenase-like cupin family protein
MQDEPMPIIHENLGSLTTDERAIADARSEPAYDRPIGLRLLHEDPDGGEEHYLVRYAAGTAARWHRRSAAHTIVVLAGRLKVNDREIEAGAYCHFAPGEPMRHEPAGNGPCLFLNLFHGTSDVEVIDEPGV